MDLADLALQNDFTEAALQAHKRLQPRATSTVMQCLDCLEPIDERRRQAAPGTQYCIDCQLLVEALQKRGLR